MNEQTKPAEKQENKAMATILPPTKSTLSSDSECHLKAKERGQRTFNIVEQDVTGSLTIAEWIKLNIETAPAAKLRDALEIAIEFRSFPRRKHSD